MKVRKRLATLSAAVIHKGINRMSRQRENDEIHINCIECNKTRLVAYWDDELESYIYLCEEDERRCLECQAPHNECVTKQSEAAPAL